MGASKNIFPKQPKKYSRFEPKNIPTHNQHTFTRATQPQNTDANPCKRVLLADASKTPRHN
jgi:hypothetical protein